MGAGPAGSSAALGALTQDPTLRVLLLDRSDFPRDKSCGDGIAPHVLDALAEVGAGDVVDDWTPIRRLELSRGAARRRGRHAPRGARRAAPGLRRPAGRPRRRRRSGAAPAPGRLGHRRGGARRDLGLDHRSGRGRRRRRALARPDVLLGRRRDRPCDRHPRLRPDDAGARGTAGHPLRRAPAAVVRLGLRPRRRPGQRRLRRAAPGDARPRRDPEPAAPARPARVPRPRSSVHRQPLARAPPAAQRVALGPARRSGAPGRGRGRTDQPDDGGGHLLRRRDRHRRRTHGRRLPGGRSAAGGRGRRTATTYDACSARTSSTPGPPPGCPAHPSSSTPASGRRPATATRSTPSSSSASATGASTPGSRPASSADSSAAPVWTGHP